MTITEEKNEAISNLALLISGRLDTTTAPELEAKLKDCTKGIRALFLDMKDVEYISSAGLRVVLLAHKLMVGTGGTMTVRNPSEFCRQVFEATGMDSVLNIV